MKTIILACIFAVMGMNSCKSSKSTNASKKAETSNTVSSPQTTRLVVEFYSIGGGVDGAAIDKFKNFADSYKTKLAYDVTRWGREGETNYCLQLNELNKKEQVVFIDEVKKLLASSQLVHIEENKECKGKKAE